MTIESLITELSKDPFNPGLNFKCAVEYEILNQTSSAVSFYLRAAEFGVDKNVPLLVYTSLIKLAKCFESLNDRVNTVSNCLLQAVAWRPQRPEAYFLLSQFYERQGAWQECYTWASMGMEIDLDMTPDLPIDVGFIPYGLLFEKSVSANWIGRRDECRKLLIELKGMNLSPEYMVAVENNWTKVGHASI